MSSGYNKTTIIACDRSQSEEALNNNNVNPAQWTNQIGTGLHLKVGDQVSVQSTFVSELGAQAGQIEIKGESVGSTETTITNLTDIWRDETLPEKYGLINASNKTVSIDVRDDKLDLVTTPYKCANGENYVFLPRRWVYNGATRYQNVFDMREDSSTAGIGKTPSTDQGATRAPQRPLAQCPADLRVVIQPYVAAGATPETKLAHKNDGSKYSIFMRTQTFFETPSDYLDPAVITAQAISGSPIITAHHGSVTTEIIPEMVLAAQTPLSAFSATASVLSVDGLKITMSQNASVTTTTHNLFTFKFPAALADFFLPPTTKNSSNSASVCESFRDPAVFGDYIQIRNLMTMNAKPGYNSPTDVSVQLTKEINKTTLDVPLTFTFNNTAESEEEEVTIMRRTESPGYKYYHCATASAFSKAYFDDWFKTDGSWGKDLAYRYLAQYQCIGIKRPLVYQTGVEMMNTPAVVNEGFRIGGEDGLDFQISTDKVLMTHLVWNEPNLLMIKKFFDSQGKSPDLFDDYLQNNLPVKVEDSRFIHMNLFDEKNDKTASLNPSDFGTNVRNDKLPELGYDLYNAAESASQTSFPLFVDYNSNTETLKGDDVGWTPFGSSVGSAGTMITDFTDLAYGFGRKVQRRSPVAGGSTKYYIGFQFTRTGNKIPGHFFHANASDGNEFQLGTGDGRFSGYDRHFSSYGNSMMLLTNGNFNTAGANFENFSFKKYQFAQQLGEKQHDLDLFEAGLYLGADGPVMNFDEVQSRFAITDLHTAETVGNRYDAGAKRTAGILPDNPNAKDPCYKLNKTMLGNTYTPEMSPYTAEFNSCGIGSASKIEATYVASNPNIEPYSVMDAHSGLFIEEWLVPEIKWNNSLAGIMGFRYDQFVDTNDSAGSTLTTSALVNEADIIGYPHNIYSSPTFGILPAIGKTATFGSAHVGRFITPPIVISPAESTKITAERLPSKTLRPYYTIRSDILLENNFLGGNRSGITLPIVSVTNKANPYGDFLNGIGGDIIFTNTIDRVVTNIRCSIHEPNGELARVDDNSAVIFKIDQQQNAQLDLVSQLLESKQKADKEAAAQIEANYPGEPV